MLFALSIICVLVCKCVCEFVVSGFISGIRNARWPNGRVCVYKNRDICRIVIVKTVVFKGSDCCWLSC